MGQKIPISQEDKDTYYPGQAFEWEKDPTSGNTVEVPAYVDYINADGTPHINYEYGRPHQPTQAEMEQAYKAAQFAADRNVQIYAQQGMFDPTRQPTQASSWRPTWLQF